MSFDPALKAHLESGSTTVCRAWAIARRDGVVMGFTDHDRPLAFEGVSFRADTGLSALALQQSTGLSVDNTEALGALSDAAIRDEDIEAGRYDGAEVTAWLVNWAAPEERQVQFRGTIGELRRAGGAFEAELRGLSAALNRPLGRIYQKPCTAVLGDGACGVDLSAPGVSANVAAEEIEDCRIFRFQALAGFEAGWFAHGRLEALEGAAAGLSAGIKRDYIDEDGRRVIELWQPLRAEIASGDGLRLGAGCDKRFETCRLKFANVLNYQGFPDLPGDGWMAVPPIRSGESGGGSLR